MAMFVFYARTATLDMIGAVVVAASCIEILKSLALPGLYEALLQQTDDPVRCHETAAFVLLATANASFVAWLIGLSVLGRYVPSVASHFSAFAVLGSRIVFDLAALQPQARLAQRLACRRLAIRTMLSITVGGAIGAALALLVNPFIGLIAYQVGQSIGFLLSTVVGTRAAAWPRVHPACFRRMRHEAILATGIRLLAATVNNLDQIIAAVVLGTAPLAFYNLGKRIETTFVNAAGSFSTILFQPQFAREGAETHHGEMLHAGITTLTIALGVPAAAFVPNSFSLVPAVFGPQWSDAAAVAAVMAVGGFIRAVGYVPGALLSVTIRNRQLLMISLTSVSGAALLMVLASPFGILWCAAALLTMHLGILVWLTAISHSDAERSMRGYFAGLVVPFVLVLAGATTCRMLTDAFTTQHGAIREVLAVAGSVAAGAAAGACYYAVHFRRPLAALLSASHRASAVRQ
jgi:O-antigen/teichoic acid export membrane protein